MNLFAGVLENLCCPRKMASSSDQKRKALIREKLAEPTTYNPDLSQAATVDGWLVHDPVATSRPTPAPPGTYLSRRQRRRRSKKHYKQKMEEEERHLEALAKLTPEEVAERPYKDLVQWWALEEGGDPRSQPVIKFQEPKAKKNKKE